MLPPSHWTLGNAARLRGLGKAIAMTRIAGDTGGTREPGKAKVIAMKPNFPWERRSRSMMNID
jgi:hypothetical protein